MPARHTAPSTDALAHDTRLAVMRLSRRLRLERADHGLGLGALSALATLERRGAMTAGALAAHEGVRPPTMTRTLAMLTERGLVSRDVDPADGRCSIVAVTPGAQALLAEDRRRREEWLAEALVALSATDRAALAEALPVMERLASV